MHCVEDARDAMRFVGILIGLQLGSVGRHLTSYFSTIKDPEEEVLSSSLTRPAILAPIDGGIKFLES